MKDLNICLNLPWVPAFDSKGPILNAVDTWHWLRDQNRIIGWTYTVNWRTLEELDIERIIANKKLDLHLPENVKIAVNTHVKCYIGQKEMVIGSYNITQPTIEDLSFLVKDKALIKYMRNVFNKHWNSLI